jgi:glycogen debranching enzyme
MARELAGQIEKAMVRTPDAPSTVPPEHPAFDPDRYWRGNVWLQVNWQIFHGLRRYGFDPLAREIAQRSATLLLRSGPHEFFNPLTGVGRGSYPYSAAAVVLDMIRTLEAGALA